MSPWPQDRREELVTLCDLLRDVASLNSGNNFIEKAKRAIEAAEKLGTSDFKTPRKSFFAFLLDQAGGEQ